MECAGWSGAAVYAVTAMLVGCWRTSQGPRKRSNAAIAACARPRGVDGPVPPDLPRQSGLLGRRRRKSRARIISRDTGAEATATLAATA